MPTNTLYLDDNWLVVNPKQDNIAVSKSELKPETCITFEKRSFTLKNSVSKGQRFAIEEIPQGKKVIQYGYPFGISMGISEGEVIHSANVQELENELNIEFLNSPPETAYINKYTEKTFKGYKRADGKVGTRNYYLVVPTSQCASQVATQIALQANGKYNLTENYLNVDGIVPIANTEGCGCASNLQIERFLLILKNHIIHPNVGGILIIDLGCEQTNYSALSNYLKSEDVSPDVPIDWITIQKEGGTSNTINKSLKIIEQRLVEINNNARTECPIEHLIVGTECGASDAYSGITANPTIGNAVDKIIYGKGSGILSEFPEMIGAENILVQRMRNEVIASKFKQMMLWYQELAKKLSVTMNDNLVPENIAGGLMNACIKSLGAIKKGGTTPIEDVLGYGHQLTQRGLNLMQGPGNDLESVTGLVASGATIICFSTGKGTITGNAIVPVIKVSSTTNLSHRLPDDIDFNAGHLIELKNERSLDNTGDALLQQIISVASGERTRPEINEQRQFQVWTAGKLSL